MGRVAASLFFVVRVRAGFRRLSPMLPRQLLNGQLLHLSRLAAAYPECTVKEGKEGREGKNPNEAKGQAPENQGGMPAEEIYGDQ